jgi:iron complex outermembrane receptor protein
MKNALFLSTAMLGALGLASQAQAQTAPAPSAAAAPQTASQSSAAASPSSIGEIVVTAQKRSESIQKVPISIAAVTGRAIQEQKLTNIQDLATLTSGLNYFTSSTGVSPYIRGFGNNTGALGNEPPATTYVDGVYLPAPSGSVFTLNNIDRIEVLKGPQGTLFGRNAAAGAVSIVTRMPQQTPSGNVAVGYANYNTVSADFYGTTGLAENLAADLSVSGFDQLQGWGHNLYNSSKAYLNNNINARTKFLWTPTNNTRITLAADYDKSREDAGLVLSAIPGTQKPPYTNAPVGGFYDTNNVENQYRVAEQGGGSLHIEHDLSWASITSITSGRRLTSRAVEDATVLPIPYSLYHFSLDETTYTQELNIQSPKESVIKWIAGFFFYNDTASYNPFSVYGTSSGQGPSGAAVFNGTQQTNSYAGYVQATTPLWTDNAHLTAGLRYTTDDHKLTQAYSNTLTSAGVLTPPTKIVNATPDNNQGALTYKVSLDYAFTPVVMGYASYNRGFKSGNYNITSAGGAASAPTKPEFVDAYEIGLKSRFFDNKVLLDVSGFYYDVTDLQVKFVSPALGLPVTGNAATARDEGFDATFEAQLTPEFQLTANVTYSDYKYSSYKNVTFFNYINGVQGSSYIADATGKEVIFAEPWSGSVGGRYHVDTSVGEITANLNLSFHAKSYFDAQNALERTPYQLLNASVGWTSMDRKWGVDVWGRNLNSAKYYINYNYAAFSGDYSPGAPMTFGARLRYSF